MSECPMCGHAVKVVGDTTRHYEPVGCFQIVDDHQVCDEQIAAVTAEVERLRELGDDLVDAIAAQVDHGSSVSLVVAYARSQWMSGRTK